MLANQLQDMPSTCGRSAAPAVNVLSFSSQVAGLVFRRTLVKDLSDRPTGAVFDAEEIALLTKAFNQAYAFFGEGVMIGRAKRTEIAHSIISLARRGIRDPHRLAIKAIVQAG